MKIYAIGIYKIQNNSNKILRHSYVQDKGILNFFQQDLLKKFETELYDLMHSQDAKNTHTFHFIIDDDNYYCKRIDNTDFFMVIITRNKLQREEQCKNTELYYLFTNIKHVFLNQTGPYMTLQTIIDNPLNFVGKDHRIEKLKEDVDTIKGKIVQAYEKVIERGERLESLKDSAFELEQLSKEMKEEAKKLNSCCYFF